MNINTAIYRSFLCIASACIFSISGLAFAAEEEKPLWELGLGIGGLSQAYYTGTKERRNFAFPVILPIYRGEVLKSDDKGMRAELFDDDRYKLDVSLDFNLAVDSDDVELRAGMPDIDSNLQIGPSLEITLAEDSSSEWRANLPIRANIGIGDDIESLGFTFSPSVSYEKNLNLGSTPWRFGASLGPQYGSADYNAIYYGVDDEFATSSRAGYQAESGYSGSRLQLSMTSKNADRLWVWFLRYENISGASFEDSPLVETDNNLVVGFIYSHTLWKSKQKAKQRVSR